MEIDANKLYSQFLDKEKEFNKQMEKIVIDVVRKYDDEFYLRNDENVSLPPEDDFPQHANCLYVKDDVLVVESDVCRAFKFIDLSAHICFNLYKALLNTIDEMDAED